MLFSTTLASMQPLGGGWSADIGEDWSQGRAAFGGLVAALGNEAMRRLVPADRELRGLNITFIGPVFAGPVRIESQILRVGRAVTIAQANLFSADVIAATLTGVYGAPRTAAISISPPAPAGIRGVDDLPDSNLAPDTGAPIFLQHFAVRWAEGTVPYTGTQLSRSKVYVRHRENAAPTESHVIALIDCIPSPVLQMMTKVAPASSVVWTLEFLRHDFSFASDAWWRIDTEVDCAADGYVSQTSLILNPAGVPAAVSHQLVAVFG
jgi:acyl-CoA thioesterase